MSGYDHHLPDISSMDELMRDQFGPPEGFDDEDSASDATPEFNTEDYDSQAEEAELRRQLGALAEEDMAGQAEVDMAGYGLGDTLDRLAALQLRAVAAAGGAAGLEIVGRGLVAPRPSADEEMELALSRMSKISARAYVAVEAATSLTASQTSGLDSGTLKAHLQELRSLQQQIEDGSAMEDEAPAEESEELLERLERLERLGARAQSASFGDLEIRGTAMPYYQRRDEYDAEAEAAWQPEDEEDVPYGSSLSPGRRFDGAFQQDAASEALLLEAVSSQGQLLRAVASKIGDMESAVSRGAASSAERRVLAGRSGPSERTHDAHLASAARELVHGQIEDLLVEDEANLPFLLRLLHGVGAMRGEMAARQRTALLQLVRQVGDAAGQAPLLAQGTALEIEEAETEDDICDDRYEEEDLYARAGGGVGRSRGFFDHFDSLADMNDEADAADGFDGEDDDEEDADEDNEEDEDEEDEGEEEEEALDPDEVEERVLALAATASTSELSALCSQLGLTGTGSRAQLLARLVLHLSSDRETAEVEVLYEGAEEEECMAAGVPLSPWPAVRTSHGLSAYPTAPSAGPAPPAPAPAAASARPASAASGKRPRPGGLASSRLEVEVASSLPSDDAFGRPKTARGRPGVDPFYYVSPSKAKLDGAGFSASFSRAPSVAASPAMPFQRLTIAAPARGALAPCSPFGSPFDKAIASADEAFEVEEEEEDDFGEDSLHPRLSTDAAQAQRPPSSSEWSLLSAGSASGCSSLEDQSPWERVGPPVPHEARVAAYLAKGTSSSAASMAAAAAAMATAYLGSGDEDEEEGEWGEAEGEEAEEGGVRASDLQDARFDFGDFSFGDVHADAPDMGSAIAALRQRLGQARASDAVASSSSRVTPSMAQLRARLDALAPHSGLVVTPSGIALSDAQRSQLTEAWREEQAGSRVDEPPRRPSDLAGDANEGVDPSGHSSSGDRKSQTEQLNQQLLASFKASLDRVGASYCPIMDQASSEPGEV